MKIKIFIVCLLTFSGFFIGFNAIAQEESTDTVIDEAVVADEEITAEALGVSDPIILPDSPLYPVKNFWLKIRTKLTFNLVKKAELQLKIASSKLLEAKKLTQKTGREEILTRALQNYQEEMEIVQNRIEAFKEKAADNPKIDKFLDKLIDKVVKQERLMTRLEQQLSDKPEVLQKLRQNQERVMEHLGEALDKLEDKDKIQQRLEKNLENIEGSKYKNFKNLEILLELENKVPEQAREAIQKAQENALKRLHGDLNNMSTEDQERFKEYLEKIGGDEDIKLEVIEMLQQRVQNRILPPALNQELNQVKRRVEERIQEHKQNCKNLCGDGICQEVVCMAIGCPCAETKLVCPADCQQEQNQNQNLNQNQDEVNDSEQEQEQEEEGNQNQEQRGR